MISEMCPQCGQGGFYVYEPVEIPLTSNLFANLFTTANYCSKCGEALYETCYSCNGTGKIISVPMIDIGLKYCSHCGRELKKKKVNNTCSSCGGKGKKEKLHLCKKYL
jgi:hypothetical protein